MDQVDNQVENRPPGGETNYGSGTFVDNMQIDTDADWLKYASDAYEASSSFLDVSLIKRWERNMDLFLSLIHISEPTRPAPLSRMPSSA